MLTLGTKIKNIAFVVIAVLVVGYIGVRYADLGHYVGLRGYYVVTMDLARAGGIFPNADVTYRGVSIGRVGDVRVTDDGVEAELEIDESAPRIPSDLQAAVASLSAVGEQYVDLQPATDTGPYLTDGSEIPLSATSTPPPVTNLLTSINDLAASVPLNSLRTVVDELGEAFRGQGQNLQVLLDTGTKFTQQANAAVDDTKRLIADGHTVLRTQAAEAEALTSFARSARLLAEQLKDSDADLRRLIMNAPGATRQVVGLLRDLDPELSVLLANLVTTSDLALTRQRGLEQLLVRQPQIVAAGSTAITSQGVHFGMSLTFFSPLPCTRGYGGTTYRNGLNTSRGEPLNTAARCTMSPSSGVDVRGSANAPSGGVPPAAQPGALGVTAATKTSLPGALALPALSAGPTDMSGLLGLDRP